MYVHFFLKKKKKSLQGFKGGKKRSSIPTAWEFRESTYILLKTVQSLL